MTQREARDDFVATPESTASSATTTATSHSQLQLQQQQQNQQQQPNNHNTNNLLVEEIDDAQNRWKTNLRPATKQINLAVIAIAWIAIVTNVAFVFFYLMRRPFERAKDDGPLIDSWWLYAALPVMYLPTLVVFSYVNWLGWSFFKHN